MRKILLILILPLIFSSAAAQLPVDSGDTISPPLELFVREGLPEVIFVHNNNFLMKAFYPDFYLNENHILKDIRSVKKSDSGLIAEWDSLGVFVLALLEEFSGIEWKEKRIDIHPIKYLGVKGLYDPLVLPIEGIKRRDYTEAPPSGIHRFFNLIQLLAGRNLLQMSLPDFPNDPLSGHPLLEPSPYRFDNVTLTLALTVAEQLFPIDSLEYILQSESWHRHNVGWTLFENHFRHAWPLTFEQPLLFYLAQEGYDSPLLGLTRPPRIVKRKPKSKMTSEPVRLATEGGRLGFSVIRTPRGYLQVVDIDTLGLAYHCGLMLDDQIKRVNNEYARNARELMRRILARLDSEGVYLKVIRADREIGLLLLPPEEIEEY